MSANRSSGFLTLLLTSAGLMACGAPPRGSERGACYANNTCDPGLSCLSSLCVRTDRDTGSSDAPDATTDVRMPDDIPVVDAGGVADTGPADTAANPVVMINHPSDMEAGRNARNDIPFIGVARDVRGTALTGMALSWNDSVAGSMGTGASISYRLSAGMHTITLTASDLEGRMGSDSIQLLVAP